MLTELFYPREFLTVAASYNKRYYSSFAAKAKWAKGSERTSLKSAMKHALKQSGQPFFDKKAVIRAIKSYYYANQSGFKSQGYLKVAKDAAHIANTHNAIMLSAQKSHHFGSVKIKIPRFKNLSIGLEWVFSALKAAIRVVGYGGGAYIVVKQVSDVINHLLSANAFSSDIESTSINAKYLIGALSENEAAIEFAQLFLNRALPIILPLVGGIIAVETGMFIGKKLYALLKKAAIYSESEEIFKDSMFAKNLQDAYYIVEKNNGRMSKKDMRKVQELLEDARVDAISLEQKLGSLHKLVQVAKRKIQ